MSQIIVELAERDWSKLEILHIDQVAESCGKYDEGKCNSPQNLPDGGNGLCLTFACPIATELDEEDSRWKEYESSDYMIVHSKFLDT